MMAHQKEPVSTPRDVTMHITITWNVYLDVRCTVVTGNVVHRYLPTFVQDRGHHADRCVNPVLSWSNPVHIRQRRNQPNSSVAAHTEIADVIKEDDACGAFRVQRFAE